ncbi:putative flavoprotein [Candidatus Nitrososphaera evergladensis SR1]|uniref:Putative flavoprotein n=1 Tax=Candidatus Nitrososphaera evergladensis SR1 TaxID=1459636 RepID=A0A075MV02_9ARCH|nr:putative flavoprotein [Candidatus Nitrososphaera evergladensis SR1]
MLKVAIILGSTRPGRNGEAVAKWVYDIAKKRTDAEFEYVDIKDYKISRCWMNRFCLRKGNTPKTIPKLGRPRLIPLTHLCL